MSLYFKKSKYKILYLKEEVFILIDTGCIQIDVPQIQEEISKYCEEMDGLCKGISIIFFGTQLVGDSETSTPLYFGKLDSEGRFESLSPIYSLIDLGGGKISTFIDEQSQNCFHIEIPQPTNKEQ